MKKQKLAAVFLIVFSLLVTATGCTLVDERAVGTINGEKIGIGEYNFFLNSVKRELLTQSSISSENEASFWASSEIDGKKASEVAKEKAFEQAVLFHVKLAKATDAGIMLTAEDKATVNAQIKNIENSSGGSSAFQASLKEIGMTEDDYKKISENSFIISKYFDQLASEEGSQIAVTDEEAQQYYDAHKNEAAFKDQVTAKHILISTVDENQQPLPEDQVIAAKAKADETYQKIIDGADFDTLMNELSEDPGLAQNPDGYTFGKGEMVQEFEDTAFSLGIDEVSEPVRSDYGYHIIKTTDIQYIPYESIQDQIKLQIQYEKFDQLAESWRSEYTITTDTKMLNSISL